MMLYAAGFNAWNQLVFPNEVEGSDITPGEPQDLTKFKLVLGGRKPHIDRFEIDEVRAGLSWTLVKCRSWKQNGKANPIEHIEVHGSLDEREWFIVDTYRAFSDSELLERRQMTDLHVAFATNGKLLRARDGVIEEFASWKSFKRLSTVDVPFDLDDPDYTVWELEQQTIQSPQPITSLRLVAGNCTFAALANGQVYTWGDGRFKDCLGQPSALLLTDGGSSPSYVSLLGRRVRHISANEGNIFAALTEDNRAFIWGIGEGLVGRPLPVNLNGKEVLDIAAGRTHMIATTVDDEIFVWGCGSNGQLGLGNKDKADGWELVPFTVPPGRKVARVFAGPRSSFILLKSVE